MIQVSKTLLAALTLTALFQSGCTTGSSGPVTITKVNPYHLQSNAFIRSEDEMIVHEQRRYLHGAVDSAEIRERYGNYFTIFWNSSNRAPATVKFEYCQASTGPQVYSKEVSVNSPKRKNVTKLEITGEEYNRLGKVTQWRASVLENGVEVAEYRSFLWQ